MESRKVFWQVFIFTILLCRLVHTLDCPRKIYVELGKDGVINCRILNDGDVYWYKGNSTKTSPIVRLENGQTEISQGNSPYDIGEEGSLIIKSIELEYYGLYSVVNFYDVDKHEADQAEVEIAVKPQTSCPLITGCNDCNHCVLTKPEMGNMSCSITGIRPPVYLSIVFGSENNLQLVRNVSKETYDPVTDTWNTTTTIEYSEWYDCGSPIQLRCVAGENQFQISDGVAYATSDSCTTATQISGFKTPFLKETNGWNLFIIVIIIAAIVASVVIVFLILFCVKKGICKDRKENDNGEGINIKLLSAAEKQDVIQSFLDHLQEQHKRSRNITYNLSQCRTIDDFFTGVSFTLENANGNITIVSTSDLIKEFFGNVKKVLFIGDGYFGRKSFMQFICSRLSDKNMDHEIILHLNLSGLESNMNIVDVIRKTMGLTDEKFSAGVLQEIVNTRKTLFVLDAIHELKHNETPPRGSQIAGITELTINDFLTSSHLLKKFRNVHCLYLFNQTVEPKTLCSQTCVFVKYEHFSKENLDKYVTTVLNFYDKASDSSSTIVERAEAPSYISKLVLEGIVKEMNICPPLHILFIHFLISDIASKNVNDLNFYISRLTYLTRLIVSCLRFQHSQWQGEKDFNRLIVKFGRLSFQNNLEQFEQISFENCKMTSTFIRNQLNDILDGFDIFRALLIGILKEVKKDGEMNDNEDFATFPESFVKFSHQYVQEFVTANAIVDNKTVLEKFLKSNCYIEDERMKRVLLFIYALKSDSRREILESLFKAEKWNIFIDCLFESEDDANFEAVKNNFRSITKDFIVNIKNMDHHYHRLAVYRFCILLSKYKVSLEALSFRKGFELDHFSGLQIHSINHLVFIELDLHDESQFTLFVETASASMNVLKGIQFIKCQCPEKISKEANLHNLRALASQKSVEVLQTNTMPENYKDKKNKWYRLNFNGGKWEAR